MWAFGASGQAPHSKLQAVALTFCREGSTALADFTEIQYNSLCDSCPLYINLAPTSRRLFLLDA